ncbi:MAG: UdgX family uracil-DNA binding protein [Acidobacteria bacterium]|nr:UdgX family uracil-DNA binding protein [Acidobacteriota bacterium]MBV9623812.1 UdgX family uracil-DNA binding protein [Acidobacteriota bacterium]
MQEAKEKFVTAAAFLPRRQTLDSLGKAAAGCKGCDLWVKATRTVFGEGAQRAVVMLVGEQPGDKEDLAGHPFVGPAGKILDESLAAAGLEKSQVYMTNVVKHFNWMPDERGKRRIHKKPRYSEIQACRPWLDAEISVTRPRIIVCLGATAAQALIGRNFRVTRRRGEFVASDLAPYVMATVHPSSILRAPDDQSRREQKQAFIRDLERVARELRKHPSAA